MKKIVTFAAAIVLVFALAAPAFATGADGAGRAYGAFHSGEARANGGFTGTSNPGLNHTGFSGFGM
jgi:hypothetical protein